MKRTASQVSTIRQVIYISKAVDDFTATELHQLATTAAQKNKLCGITGALLFIDKCFIQVIEGDEAAMSTLLVHITADPRHRDIRVISDQLGESRHFADWSMGLISTPEEEKPRVVKELRSASATLDVEENGNTISPMPHIVAMMQRLYETDSVLQHARR